MRWTLWLALPIAALYASSAYAAESGDMRGKVVDESGAPIVGATITVSGPNIAGTAQTTTDKNGEFQLLGLPVGAQEVMIEADGYGPIRMLATVRLDETMSVPATLTKSTVQEVVVVEAEEPVIDSTKSSISDEVNDDLLQNLPVGRSYQSAVQMLPGVYGRVNTTTGSPGSGNPSVRGEGAYGNNYYVDGISTRDPATKTFGSDMNFDSIKSIQVYTDGAPAEFGQATGMMVNVVTKDGGDEHHGTVAYYFSHHASGGTYPILDLSPDPGACPEGQGTCEVPTQKRRFLSNELSLTAGGPIIKEKLWYYVALDGSMGWTRFEGQDPATDPQRAKGIQGFAKLTWFATPDLTFQYEINGQGGNTKNRISSSLVASEAQEQSNSYGISHIFTAKWRPTPKGELQLKASYLPINVNSVPQVGDQKTPQVKNVNTGEVSGNASSFDYNIRSRLGAQLEYTQIANAGGSHRIKAGVEYWTLRDSRNLVFTGGSGTVPGPFQYQGSMQYPDGYAYDGIQYFTDPENGLTCDQDTNGDGLYDNCWGFTTYKNVGALGHRGGIFGAYLQDDYRPIDQLTLNVGVRVDTESLYANVAKGEKGNQITSAIMPAPRVGIAWDITGDSKTLFSANFGQYYDLQGNTFADWGDTRSAFVFGSFQRDGQGNYEATNIQDPASNPLVYCTKSSLDSYEQSLIDPNDPTSADAAASERALAESYCKGTLKPYHMDKVALAFEREIVPFLAVGVHGIWSQTVNMPEDVDINLDTWVIANPRNPTTGKSAKKRDYRALEFTLTKKFDKNWGALASWTISESKGNMPGQFELASGGETGSNGNGVGVYLDDISDPDTRAFFYDNGLGWLPELLAGLGTVYDDAGYYGYLPYHSLHQVKVNGFYTFDFGTTLGAVFEYNSGRAWQKRGMVPLYGDYFSFPEGRGSRFMPPVAYIDFRIGQRIKITDTQSVEVNVDLFNLPDLKTPVTYYENDNESFGKTLFRQAPRSLRAGVKYTF